LPVPAAFQGDLADGRKVMFSRYFFYSVIMALTMILPGIVHAGASTAFTYQGQLQQANTNFSDTANLAFRLYDEAEGGTMIGTENQFNGHTISDGLFMVTLDFGVGAFTGEPRWLEVRVNDEPLDPRQAITPTPMAVRSLTSAGLSGYPVADAAPGIGQVLRWQGSAWAPDDDVLTELSCADGQIIHFSAGQWQCSGANTLNQAYNEGGAGAGRIINATDGAVEISASNGTSPALEVNTSEANSFGVDISHNATGVGLRSRSLSSANTFAALQAETNSSAATNSAITGENSGGGYAIAGQIPQTATGTAAIFGNNLRTAGGAGVSGVGTNGVVGESTNPAGFGIFGNNPSSSGLAVGTYGIGFNGVYGETHDAVNGWSGYFTADVGIEGDLYVIGSGNFNISDKRLKRDFQSISSPLARLMELNGQHYTISYPSTGPDREVTVTSRTEYGLTAQDVQALFPEMVASKPIFENHGDDTEFLAVNYTQMVPVLIEAIKELKTELDELRMELDTLKETRN
jgi:hypothetical protein